MKVGRTLDNLFMFHPIAVILIGFLFGIVVGGVILFFVGRKYQKHREPETIRELKNRIIVLEMFQSRYWYTVNTLKKIQVLVASTGTDINIEDIEEEIKEKEHENDRMPVSSGGANYKHNEALNVYKDGADVVSGIIPKKEDLV